MLGILQIQVGRGAVVLLLVPLLVARSAFQAAVKMQGAFESTVESLITAVLGSAYTQILTFTLVIVALALMPHGLFGRAELKKV